MTTKVQKELSLPADLFDHVAPVLRVLGHPDRLRLVDLLLRREVPVSALAAALGLAPNAVSQHLGKMLARGIVARRRRGKQVYYRVVHPAARSLLVCMRRNVGKL